MEFWVLEFWPKFWNSQFWKSKYWYSEFWNSDLNFVIANSGGISHFCFTSTLGTRVWSLIISFNIHFAHLQEPLLPHSVSQLGLSLNAKLSFISQAILTKLWILNLITNPNKLRFELGSTQAEAVRLLCYKKFKFSWD